MGTKTKKGGQGTEHGGGQQSSYSETARNPRPQSNPRQNGSPSGGTQSSGKKKSNPAKGDPSSRDGVGPGSSGDGSGVPRRQGAAAR